MFLLCSLCSPLAVLYALVPFLYAIGPSVSPPSSLGSEPERIFESDWKFLQNKTSPGSQLQNKTILGPELIVDGNFLQHKTIGNQNANWVSTYIGRSWSVNAAGFAQGPGLCSYIYQRVHLEAKKTYRLSFNAWKAFSFKRQFLQAFVLEAPVTYGLIPPTEDQWNKDPNRPTTKDPANRILIFLDGRDFGLLKTPTNAATGFIKRQIANGTNSIDFLTAVDGEYVVLFWARGDGVPIAYRAAVGNVSLRAVSDSTWLFAK